MNTKQILAIIGTVLATVGTGLSRHVNSPVAYWIGEVITPMGVALMGSAVAMKHPQPDQPNDPPTQ